MKFLLPLFALLASVFVACNKDGFFSNSPSVSAAFAGRVMDENGQPIAGAQVRVEGELTTTDANGVFRLRPIRVPADNAKLMVSKIGYFEFSRAYYVEADALQTVSIQLLHKDQIGTVNASEGGTVQVPGGAALVFPAGAFSDPHGKAYNGTVRIFARRLDLSSPDCAMNMPGDSRGINAAGAEQFLGTHGMVGVELQGQAGQSLRIRQGSEVEIRLPISPSQSATAPAEIALWHYDLLQARWLEEGTAQRIGNEYVGSVKHFSFWNFSTAFNLVELEGKVFLVDDQHPFSGAVVRLTMTSDSTKGYATVNANGAYKGGVPMGGTFIMDILSECGEVIFTQSIGPINEPTIEADVIVPNNGTHTVALTGRLLDCAGAPIKNGYAQVLLGNFKWVAFTGIDGSFALNKTRCDTSAGTGVVIGFDLQNLKQSPPDTITVPPNAVAVGDLAVCDSLGEYIIFSLDYNDFIIAVPVGGVLDSAGMRTFLSGYSTVQHDVGISMEFASSNQPGIFPLSNLYVNTLILSAGLSEVSVEVVEPGYAVGDPIVGTFEGTFVDQLGLTHTISGSYQVRRDY
ncbi:MAG: carboxypeptidase-like regulatory domain-containing protein [Saprospiraceae bacterium]